MPRMPLLLAASAVCVAVGPDHTGRGNTSWNSAHATRGCSRQDPVSTGGAGRFSCFAVN